MEKDPPADIVDDLLLLSENARARLLTLSSSHFSVFWPQTRTHRIGVMRWVRVLSSLITSRT